MSRFKPVVFEEVIDENDQPKVPTFKLNEDKLKAVIKEINDDFESIKIGTSDLTTYAINPGSFSFPASNRLKMLSHSPTKKNLEGFLEIAAQDFGAKAVSKWRPALYACVEEDNNE